jgi:purine nucleosidase
MSKQVIVDTDTAGDDTQALVMALRSQRLTVEAVTVVAGNVPFEYEVENAKYTLSLLDREDVPVYEGARSPLLKEWEHAEQIHGEGGLGGDLFPDTGVESADDHAVDAIVDRARAAPGECSLLCLGPLTNVALAVAREPDLPDLLDEVVVMGGAVGCLGNDTPAAEFNFWVDPDAAKRVLAEFDVTLVDWGLTMRDGFFGADEFARLDGVDTAEAEFFETIMAHLRALTRENDGRDGVTLPDPLAAACLIAPEVIDERSRYHVDVDEREGMTRGYSLVDVNGVLDEPANATVIESVDSDLFAEMVLSALTAEAPETALPD